MNPEISVIVPVYKAEKYLWRCVDSILNQQFTDFELILVDDGSPDKCPAICDEYKLRDNRVHVIHKDNGGVSSARNAGLSEATGRYVMFADSDDYVDSRWCATLHATIKDNPNAWICCNVWSVPADERAKDVCGGGDTGNQEELIPSCCSVSFYELYKRSFSGAVWNKIYDKSVIDNNSLRFDNTKVIGEDVRFNMQYYRFCESILYIREPLYYYVAMDESLSRKYNPDSFDMHRSVFADRLPYLEKEHIGDFADEWLYRFITMLDEAIDLRSSVSFVKKLRYCHKMMNTDEFCTCTALATGSGNSSLFIKVIKTHNFYLFWLFRKINMLKNILRK